MDDTSWIVRTIRFDLTRMIWHRFETTGEKLSSRRKVLTQTLASISSRGFQQYSESRPSVDSSPLIIINRYICDRSRPRCSWSSRTHSRTGIVVVESSRESRECLRASAMTRMSGWRFLRVLPNFSRTARARGCFRCQVLIESQSSLHNTKGERWSNTSLCVNALMRTSELRRSFARFY